jgi:hypothetical protein
MHQPRHSKTYDFINIKEENQNSMKDHLPDKADPSDLGETERNGTERV